MTRTLRSPNFEIDLSRFDKAVQIEPKYKKEFAEIPDGKYDVRIEDAELYQSPKSGNPVLKYTLRVISPTNANQLMWKRRGITSKTRDYAEQELKICGLELPRFSDLKNHLHELIGVELEVTRKSRGEDVNIYFNDQRSSTSKSKAEEDDDLPF